MAGMKYLVIVAFFSSALFKAAEAQTYSSDWVGIWQVGECDGADLSIVSNGLQVIAFEDDGTISVSDAQFGASGMLLKRDSGALLVPAASLRSCASIAGHLQMAFGEAISLFIEFGEVSNACQTLTASRCIEEAFSIVDITQDGRLSRAELSRFGRAVSFFGGYEIAREIYKDRADGRLVEVSELYGTAALSNALAPAISANLLASYDYDDDGSLSLGEILADRQNIQIADLSGLLGREALQFAISALSEGIGSFGAQAMRQLIP